MNAGTQTSRSAPLSVAANEDQTQKAGFSADFQDLCSRAMDQALGIEKASLSTVVTLNSCVLDIYQEASLRFTPAFGNLFDLAAQAVACSIELQMNWLTLLASPALSHVAAAGSQSQPTEEDLTHCMDIAIGERVAAPSSTVTSISGGLAKPQRKAKAHDLERSMDIAVGMRKAA